MPMFVTFYSFKGGVGRTLALANVATLLATDREEPCRVLVWDFDLAAPGLQQVLNCKWKGKAREGFLDYVHHYCTKAEIEPIDRFICKTDIGGVDILPAGWMGRRYAAKLDEIHWQEIYRLARGYQFIEATKKQITEMKPEYDYVLIDSLTGYSDVGGICVNQLADVVVLLFRLNRQNVEGIAKIYRSIQKARKEASSAVKTLPVISPAWPFASPEADEWVAKVRRVFAEEWPLTISFDGSLSFGERIISNQQRRHPMSPKILDDYRKLARSLRRLNPQDPQTIYHSIQELQREYKFSQAFEACVTLVKRRPQQPAYWQQLVNTALISRSSEEADKFKDAIRGIVDEACQGGNPSAYVARYQLRSLLGTEWKEALGDLNKAVEIDRSQPEVYYLRGIELLQQFRYEQAIDDFTTYVNLQGNRSDASRGLVARAQCYAKLGQNEKAIEDLRRAGELRPKDEGLILLLARVLYASHQYREAEAAIRNALELEPKFHKARIFSAHVLCALGDRAKASDELRQAMQGGLTGPGDVLDAAEAYLVVDPKETLTLLDRSKYVTHHQREAVVPLLRALAAELLDEAEVKAESMRSFDELGVLGRELDWSFAELKEFLEWGVTRGRLTEEKRTGLKAMIEHFETPKPSK